MVQQRRSSARRTEAVEGGGEVPASVAQTEHNQEMTGVTAGQARKVWERVSICPSGTQSGWLQRGEQGVVMEGI